MTEEEKATTTKPAPRQSGPHFIPQLKGKKVTIRLVSITPLQQLRKQPNSLPPLISNEQIADFKTTVEAKKPDLMGSENA